MDIRNNVLKLKLSKEQIELLNKASKLKNMSISEYMLELVEEKVCKESKKEIDCEKLNERVMNLENKLQEIKYRKWELQESNRKCKRGIYGLIENLKRKFNRQSAFGQSI